MEIEALSIRIIPEAKKKKKKPAQNKQQQQNWGMAKMESLTSLQKSDF